jgi:hypothetical protein
MTNEVFLSYARIDDEKDAWVEQFESRLTSCLKEYLGRTDVHVFRDKRSLDENQRFDEQIKNAVRNSAVLVTVISKSFLNSTYCRQEVHSFCDAARTGLGLTVGQDQHGRIFNVLRFNIPYADWFKELGGVNPFPFYTGAEGGQGSPIGPETEEGQSRIRNLAQKIVKTLELMRNDGHSEMPRRRRAGTDPMKVFLPPLDTALEFDRQELEDKFRRCEEPVQLYEATIAGPADLIQGFRSADLSIVLADARPIPDTLRQLEYAHVYAPAWILAVDPAMNLSQRPSGEYHSRLIGLRDAQGNRNYKFFHRHDPSGRGTLDVETVYDEALASLKEMKRQRESYDLMFDLHREDRPLYKEIADYIASTHHGVGIRMASATDSQAAVYRKYEDVFNQCRGTMFIYGACNRDWVANRLNEVKKVFREQNVLDKALSVFYAPPPPDAKPRFDPIKLGPSTRVVLYDIDYTRNWKQEIDDFLKEAGF